MLNVSKYALASMFKRHHIICTEKASVQMEELYNPHKIEKQVQVSWEDQQCFEVTEDSEKEKYYCLSMFPYPSGRLHMGHVRNYTIGDVISRYQRMLGKNVLQPMGWDAFGLPAENAAIANDTAPAKWTDSNISYMKKQLKRLGFGYDWSREITTCKPDYYRWEQWFFGQLYNKGLVYKKMATVNWCPKDKTVLANEQVENGKCWRCETPIELIDLPQWFIRITQYADELLNDLDKLPQWPDKVKAMQANWIGRSTGVDISFKLVKPVDKMLEIKVYTTRPDTLFGVTYLALAPQHPIVLAASVDSPSLQMFIKSLATQKVSEVDAATIEKQGCDTGISVIHPLTGESIPVWTANFVLMAYGSGAVMSVPAHDVRDWEFAQKYNLNIKQVIKPILQSARDSLTQNKNPGEIDIYDVNQQAYIGEGVLIQSDKFNDLSSKDAVNSITDHLVAIGKGCKKINYRLRDWGVSRQRYWGTPIPMYYCGDEAIPVPPEDLPVILPEDVIMDGVHSPLKTDSNWSNTIHNGERAIRETDTFDTFMESSWYYARYCCPNFDKSMLDVKSTQYWLPVDQYIGGIEHAVMHLLYARFFHKVLRDADMVEGDEPFKRLLCQGMVLADAFYIPQNNGGKLWVAADTLEIERDNKGVMRKITHIATGEDVMHLGMTKMSKSKHNGIDPQGLIDRYGADTVRLYIMFASPPDQSLEWSESGVEGAYRFLKKLWKLVFIHNSATNNTTIPSVDKLSNEQKDLYRKIHQTIQKVTYDYGERLTFNTAIAAVMELNNSISSFKDRSESGQAVLHKALESCVLLLSPITPHICQYLWESLGNNGLIITERWPEVDDLALVQDKVTLVVQINGKVRAHIDSMAGADKESIEDSALKHHSVIKYTEGKTIRKIIHVPGKLINIVVG